MENSIIENSVIGAEGGIGTYVAGAGVYVAIDACYQRVENQGVLQAILGYGWNIFFGILVLILATGFIWYSYK